MGEKSLVNLTRFSFVYHHDTAEATTSVALWMKCWLGSQNTVFQISHASHCKKAFFSPGNQPEISTLCSSTGTVVGGGEFSTLVMKSDSPTGCFNCLALSREGNSHLPVISPPNPLRFLCYNRCLWHSGQRIKNVIHSSNSVGQVLGVHIFWGRALSFFLPLVWTKVMPCLL